jgi:hypothetical protein
MTPESLERNYFSKEKIWNDSIFSDYDVLFFDPFPPVPPQNPERGPRDKVLQKLLRLFQNQDCIRFLESVIQQATLLAAGQTNFANLDSAGKQLYNTNPHAVITQVMNAQFINQGSQSPQEGNYVTRALAGPFDYPKTITLYSGYFGASTKEQSQILVHEGTHLIYPFSDSQLAAAAGVPASSNSQSSANYQHELERRCK